MSAVGGILLTGGLSRRMGFDKASLSVDGRSNAVRLGALLAEVASPVIEVGPGRSGLSAVTERPPGAGPLAGVCAGAAALVAGGFSGPVLVIACDMPFLGVSVLQALAQYPGGKSVVPLVKGYLQPLCARWSPGDVLLAGQLLATGDRSMKSLLHKATFVVFGASKWPAGVSEDDFADIDTPEELDAYGFSLP